MFGHILYGEIANYIPIKGVIDMYIDLLWMVCTVEGLINVHRWSSIFPHKVNVKKIDIQTTYIWDVAHVICEYHAAVLTMETDIQYTLI